MSLGGADVAWSSDPLGALGLNPAGLSSLDHPTLNVGATGVFPYGDFSNRLQRNANLDENAAFGPDTAFGSRLGSSPFSLGFGVIPDAFLGASYVFRDPPGGLDGKTTYGVQRSHSEIELLRFATGMSVALTSKLAIGATLGLSYNKNSLDAPYVFQTQHQIAGFKTLLNLDTDGWGWNATTGLIYRPIDTLQLGLAYKSETVIHSHGDAYGDAGAQLRSLGGGFASVQPTFHYDAEVDNSFPQQVSAGVSWKCCARVRLSAQIDWVDWHNSFNNLAVKLKNGNNRDLNNFLGSKPLEDDIPLHWKDRLVYRTGLEYSLTKDVTLRGGYSYGASPVPTETLSPLTAVITEHTLTAGVGYRWKQFDFDLGYEWDIPVTRSVGMSGLRSGELNGSTTTVGVQALSFVTTMHF